MTAKTLKDTFLDVVAYAGSHREATEKDFNSEGQQMIFRIHQSLLDTNTGYKKLFNAYSKLEKTRAVGEVTELASRLENNARNVSWGGIWKLASAALSHGSTMARANRVEEDLYKIAVPLLQDHEYAKGRNFSMSA